MTQTLRSPGPVMARQAPDWDGTGTGILWTMAPPAHHRLPAGHWVVLLETPVLSPTCQDESADARLGQGTRRGPGHLKKSVLTFSGTLKIFTVWGLNFSPENCPEWPGRRAVSLDIYWVWPEIAKLELTLLSWLKQIGGGNFRNILKC